MIGFKTGHSIYYVDTINHLITGGIFKDKHYIYVKLSAIIGERGTICLDNGKIINTGVIKEYITI